MNKKRTVILLACIVVLGALFRIFFPASIILTTDSTLYISLAERITEGYLTMDHANAITEIIQPGYSFFIMAVSFVLQNGEMAGIFISFMSGIGLILLSYWCGKKFFSDDVGLIAAAIVSCYPLMIYYSTTILTEALFTLVFIAAIFLGWRAVKTRKWGYFLLLGIIVGISYYIRIVGLAAIPVLTLWLVIEIFVRKRIQALRALGYFGLFILGLTFIISPYLIFLYNEKQSFVITGAQEYAYSMRTEHSPEDIKTPEDRQFIFYGLTEDNTSYASSTDIGSAAKRDTSPIIVYWQNFSENFLYNISFALLLFFPALAATGYIAYRHKKKDDTIAFAPVWYLWSWVPFYSLIYWMGPTDLRYYVPILPVLFLIISYGIILFINQAKEKYLKVVISSLVIVGIVLFGWRLSQEQGFFLNSFGFWEKSIEERIGQEIEPYVYKDARILSTYSIITYYVEGQHYQLPVDDYSSITTFAKHNAISYLLLYQPENQFNRPELNVMYTIREDDNVNLLYSDGVVYLFEFKDEGPV